MKNILTFFVVAVGGAPLAAEGFSERPASCVLAATAQSSDCQVENFYRCSTSKGTEYRIESFDSVGMHNVSRLTADFLPVDTKDFSGDGIVFTRSEGLHPRDALKVGKSAQSLSGYLTIFGLSQPANATVELLSTHQSVELGGKRFETMEGQIAMTMTNAGAKFTGQTTFAYSHELDLLVEIQTETNFGSREFSKVEELFLPGQPGFGEEQPRHGCLGLSSLERQHSEAS